MPSRGLISLPIPMNALMALIRKLPALAILSACAGLGWWLLQHPPESPQMPVVPTLLRVEAKRLEKASHQVRVRSQGVVAPRTRSVLLPEVSGRIVEMATSFRPGGFFSKGDLLLRLDEADYQAALVMARAEVAACEVVLAEEQARSQQARESWVALGKQGEAPGLVLRIPQVTKAKADLAAAQAKVERAQRDLQRTRVVAPYDGQVLRQAVDVGQFVNSATVLGEIFAADRVEIRLPLPERESRFLRLPQPFRGENPFEFPEVVLLGRFAGREARWQGKIVRVEGSLDEQTRQVMAVAQVEDPYGRREGGAPPLVVGTFVEALIEGESIEPVYRIERRAVRAGNEVIFIDEPSFKLRRATLDALVVEEDFLVVSASGAKAPAAGTLLCLTPIAFPADGALVEPSVGGQSLATPQAQRSPGSAPMSAKKGRKS